MDDVRREKLVIDLPEDAGSSAETVWVVRASPSEDFFKLDNIPAFAYGLALDDVVRAIRHDDGRFHFVDLVKPSGLLTVRLSGPRAEENVFKGIADLLRKHAIASEGYTERYIAYAMNADAFSKVGAAIDAMIGDSEDLCVEIAND